MPAKSARRRSKKRVVAKLKPKAIPRRGWKARSEAASKYLVTIFMFGLASLFLAGLAVYKEFDKHFASAFSFSAFDISGSDLFTVMYVSLDGDFFSEPLTVQRSTLLVFDRERDQVFAYEVPLDLVIEVSGRFGEESISKVFALGALNSDGSFSGGVQLMEDTFKRLFGLNVDKYIVVGNSLSYAFDSFLLQEGDAGILKPEVLKELKGSLRTNLSLGEFYMLYKCVSSLSENSFVYEKVNDLSLIDKSLRNITYDSYIAKEEKSVAILNGTDVPALASFGSRVVENIGGHVIAVENARGSYKESVLVVDDASASVVVYLVRFFNISKVVDKGSLSESIAESVLERADVTLIIGLDIAEDL